MCFERVGPKETKRAYERSAIIGSEQNVYVIKAEGEKSQ